MKITRKAEVEELRKKQAIASFSSTAEYSTLVLDVEHGIEDYLIVCDIKIYDRYNFRKLRIMTDKHGEPYIRAPYRINLNEIMRNF